MNRNTRNFLIAAAAAVLLLIVGYCYVTDPDNLFEWATGSDSGEVLGE